MDSRLRGVLHHLNRLVIQKYATDYWACSEAASRWFYRDSLKDQVQIIHNAISTERMQFDPKKRQQLREQLGLRTAIHGNVEESISRKIRNFF